MWLDIEFSFALVSLSNSILTFVGYFNAKVIIVEEQE